MIPRFKAAWHVYGFEQIGASPLPNKTLTRLHPDGCIVCTRCGITATHVAHWRHKNESETTIHADYFAMRPSGFVVLMTKDHIIPKSLGGTNALANFRTMCSSCNASRGNKIEIDDLIEIKNRSVMITRKQRKAIGWRNNTHPLLGWIDILTKYPDLRPHVTFK